MGIKILGTGSYLPEKVVTNEDIAKTLYTFREIIVSARSAVDKTSRI